MPVVRSFWLTKKKGKSAIFTLCRMAGASDSRFVVRQVLPVRERPALQELVLSACSAARVYLSHISARRA